MASGPQSDNAAGGVALPSHGQRQVPANVVMGELGAGKTTVILSLVRQVARDNYKVVWLKNEYGDVNIDGLLAEEQGITTEEIMNGCVCCTAIGNLEDAIGKLLELEPDRIVIETAGTAHPAPIAMELKRFPNLLMDSFIEVVDAVNFKGYGDVSLVGQSQARYVDFIVINKTGLVDARRLDEVTERINDNFTDTPKLPTEDGFVPAELLLGDDTVSVVRQLTPEQAHLDAHASEAHVRMEAFSCHGDLKIEQADMETLVEELPNSDIYRVKGAVLTAEGWQVMNAVANRVTWQPLSRPPARTEILFVGPYAKEHEQKVRDRLKKCDS